jgi:hypothetical protein
MATASVLVKHLGQTYDAIQTIKLVMQSKMDSLHISQPYYMNFEIEGEQHTYANLIAESLQIEGYFDSLVAAIKDWDITGITVGEAIDLLQTNQKPLMPTTVALQSISNVPTPMADCADLVLNLFQSIAVFRSRAAPAAVKRDIKNRMRHKDVTRHLEVPLINISAECNDAYKEVKVLTKMLMNFKIQNTTVRQELTTKQSMIALTATGNAPTSNPNITYLLKFKTV